MIRRLMRTAIRRSIPALVSLLSLCAVSTAAAQERRAAVQLSGGVYNVGKSPTQAEAGVELRAPIRLWRLDFMGGISATEEGSFWGYGGLRVDLEVGERFVVSPGFAVALYEEGDGKDLGGVVEFRSSIDFGYQVTSKARLGFTFYHLSNAGLYDQNPGANSAVITYSVRLR